MKTLAFHKKIFILSCFVGLIYGSHHFFIPYFLSGEDYYPVTSIASPDEGMFNGPRANAVYNGQFFTGDINLAEHRSDPSFLPLLNPMILGVFGRLLGSLNAAFILSDILFPSLIFIVLYFLAFELLGSQIWAAAFAALFIFTPKLAIFPSPDALAFFAKYDQLYFSRIEYPKITFLFFVSAMYFALRALKREDYFSAVYGGIFFGAMFYTYLYDWAYFFAGLSFVALFFLPEKDWKKLKIVFTIIFTGALISAYYWINFLSFHSLPQYYDIVLRVGTAISSDFAFKVAWKSYLRIVFLVVALWFVRRRSDRPAFNYLSGFLLAYFAVMNAQVFVGFNPQPDHWYKISFLPIALTGFSLCFWVYKKHFKYAHGYYLRAAMRVLVLVIFTWGAFSQFQFSKANSHKYTIDRNYAKSYRWLNSNTPAGSVVGTISISTNDELQLFTRNKILVPNGANTTASNDEIWERLSLLGRIYSLPAENFIHLAREGEYYLFHGFYNDHSFNSYFYQEDPVDGSREKAYAQKLSEYKKLLSGNFVSDGQYKLDYLYFGPREKLLGKDPAETIKNLNKIYDEDGIMIYALLYQ